MRATDIDKARALLDEHRDWSEAARLAAAAWVEAPTIMIYHREVAATPAVRRVLVDALRREAERCCRALEEIGVDVEGKASEPAVGPLPDRRDVCPGDQIATVEGIPVAFIRDLAEVCRLAELDPAGLKVPGEFCGMPTAGDPLGICSLSAVVSVELPKGVRPDDHMARIRRKALTPEQVEDIVARHISQKDAAP